MKRMKLKLTGGTAAVVAVIGGGAALAADRPSPKGESDAIVADAAEELGVTSAELEAALKQALRNRVDAAVADGRLTEAQATALRARIDAGEVPLLGLAHDGRRRELPRTERGDAAHPPGERRHDRRDLDIS